jgi:hypothetical protein
MPSLTTTVSARGAARALSRLGRADGKDGWNEAVTKSAARGIATTPSPDAKRFRTTRQTTSRPRPDGDVLVDPALGWKEWRLLQGGLLPLGGSLTIGEGERDYRTTPYDHWVLRNGAIDAQRRVDEVARRIMGPWDARMREGGTAVFGFGEWGPSWQEKVHLARNFQAIALRLRGNVRVNLCHRHEIAGADGFVPREGPGSPIHGDVHMALEYIRDPKSLHQIGLCLVHEIGHQVGLNDTGYVNKQALFDHGEIRYDEGAAWPLYNADSYAAFVYFFSFANGRSLRLRIAHMMT